MDIKKAREMLAAAKAEEPDCTCSNPQHFHEQECPWTSWLRTMPEANVQIYEKAPPAWAVLILAVEALEESRALIHAKLGNQSAGPTHGVLQRAKAALAAWEAL